jgi:hypothetical protein
MMLIVQLGDGLSQTPNAGRGPILPAVLVDRDRLGPLEAAGDVVAGLGGSLAQVGPLVRVVEVSEVVGALAAPDDTRAGAGGVEARVRVVALMALAELQVDCAVELWGGVRDWARRGNRWREEEGGYLSLMEKRRGIDMVTGLLVVGCWTVGGFTALDKVKY